MWNYYLSVRCNNTSYQCSNYIAALWRHQRRQHTYFGLHIVAMEQSCVFHRCSYVYRREKERKGRKGGESRIEKKVRIG